MNRAEAVDCLKEIMSACCSLCPDAVTLFSSKPTDPLSMGYQVHIKTSMDPQTFLEVKRIVEKSCLALKQECDKMVIYQPKASAITK